MPKIPVITIDGSSGTGKGVISHLVAQELGWHFLDSGALYRLLALAADQAGMLLDDELALQKLAEKLDIKFTVANQSDAPEIFLSGKNVTDAIRTENIGNLASKIAVLPRVRTALLERQSAFRKAPGLVADGRDMGTVIFPDADVKIFLTASPDVRAYRRYKQLLELGISVNLADLVEELRERDKRDMERVTAPLKPAADAITIDTSSLTIDEVFESVMAAVKNKL